MIRTPSNWVDDETKPTTAGDSGVDISITDKESEDIPVMYRWSPNKAMPFNWKHTHGHDIRASSRMVKSARDAGARTVTIWLEKTEPAIAGDDGVDTSTTVNWFS